MLLVRNHAPPRATPTVVYPSPFQSPVIGWSLGAPKAKVPSATDGRAELLRNHEPARNTPIVSVPVRFQSPNTAMSPGDP